MRSGVMLFAMLKNSYPDRGDTYLWAILVLLVGAFALMPFLWSLEGIRVRLPM
jgi:hypothetical protein